MTLSEDRGRLSQRQLMSDLPAMKCCRDLFVSVNVCAELLYKLEPVPSGSLNSFLVPIMGNVLKTLKLLVVSPGKSTTACVLYKLLKQWNNVELITTDGFLNAVIEERGLMKKKIPKICIAQKFVRSQILACQTLAAPASSSSSFYMWSWLRYKRSCSNDFNFLKGLNVLQSGWVHTIQYHVLFWFCRFFNICWCIGRLHTV